MEQKLISFIKKELLSDSKQEISSSTKMISSGMIDSFSLVNLHVFIEKEFGKKLPTHVINVENFDTVDKIIETINKY